jgi:glucokinase
VSDDFVVAVDVGGTLTKISYTDRSGAASEVWRRTTERSSDAVSLPWLAGLIREFAASRGGTDCRGFGIAVPGIVDTMRGVVRAAPNLGWVDIALRDDLCRLSGLPGQVGHDVRLGGLAEWQLGAGVGSANLMFLALGTGIAAALVVDGRLLEADGYCGEIGHLTVEAGRGIACPCGRVGCLETVASASGLSRGYRRLTGETVTASEVADRARSGEPAAAQAFALVTEALAEALDAAVTVLAPELIVIGGGLSGSLDLFAEPLSRRLDNGLTFQRRPRLAAARLGADAGVIGAGILGWRQFGALSV